MKKARRTVIDNGEFMDSAALAAESWPLLLGLPLIAGIVSLAIVAVTPTQYLARTAIPLVEQAQALIDSREFSEQFAASGLASDDFAVVAQFDSATRSTVITTMTTNADDARTAVENTIETLRILAPIQSSSLAREAELLSAQIGQLEAFTTSLEASAEAPTSPETSTLAITDAVVALMDAIRTKQDRLGALQDQLEIAEQIAAMPPEIDVAPVAKDWRVVLAAILAGATLSGALVYARIRLMQASKIPGFEEKRASIVRALTLNLIGGRTENGESPDSMAASSTAAANTASPTQRPLRVLYIDGVGPFGGASRSLFEGVRALPPGSVQPLFIAADGTALDFYRQLTDQFVVTRGLTRFDNTRYSHYRGLRWLVLLRELYHIPFMLKAIGEARQRWGSVDVIHANEITEIIPLLLAMKRFGAPGLVHVRSMQRKGDQSLRSRWLWTQLRERLSGIVAIDQNVRSTLPEDADVTVIHNSFTPARAPRPDPNLIAHLDRLLPTSLKVGFIGNLHRGKGLMDLLDAAKIVINAGRDVEFLIIGGQTRNDRSLKARALQLLGLAQNVQEQLEKRISELGLGDRFHLFGSTTDIQRVYERLDVLCFPSHFDAAGRPVFEAAYSSVPSIASISDPRPDTLDHGETGLAIPATNPQKLAEAIMHFADNRHEVQRMGENARKLAHRNFDPAANSRQLLALYRRLAGHTADAVNGQ